MKKRAFTHTELIISFLIMLFSAALTLPSFIQNIEKQSIFESNPIVIAVNDEINQVSGYKNNKLNIFSRAEIDKGNISTDWGEYYTNLTDKNTLSYKAEGEKLVPLSCAKVLILSTPIGFEIP